MTLKRKTRKTKTKQTIGTGTESEKWTYHGRFSVGGGRGGIGENVQERISIIGRNKIDGERSKWYRKQRIQRTYMYNPWT